MSTSRSYLVELPFELAQQVEELASRDSKTVGDLLRDALRVYSAMHLQTRLDEIAAYAASRKTSYTEDDIPKLIADVRSEHTTRV